MARALAAIGALIVIAPQALAFEALDGRIQAHGFFESQLRTLSGDYGEDWDVAQWYQVFNLELEMDILPDGWGPFDLVSGYARAEVRYDCVYSRGCGMFRSVNAYGDRSKSLPRRLSNANQLTFNGAIDRAQNAAGTTQRGDRRSGDNTDPVGLGDISGYNILFSSAGFDGADNEPTKANGCNSSDRKCSYFAGGSNGPTKANAQAGNINKALRSTDADRTVPLNDDPGDYVFEHFQDHRFTQVNTRGGGGGGLTTNVLGPWLPKNSIEPNAGLADRINPFDRSERSPTLAAAFYNNDFLANVNGTGLNALPPGQRDAALLLQVDPSRRQTEKNGFGSGASYFRAIPDKNEGRRNKGDDIARGMYIPSEALRDQNQNFDNPDFFFREKERAWNRGQSQQQTKELKEAYLDMEFLDSQLWIRAGKQSIVWGKTELFRTTDQFNPQDLALASLPSLEESRIALWALRAVYSFYEVGPFEDVRVEAAFNFDKYQGADLGGCGEAYTANLVCAITFGMFAHGTAGVGVAGVDRPDNPWNSLKGWEAGARLEFRWDRFSFAIIDFYGFGDTPTIKEINRFERNVDPDTGRPRAEREFGKDDVCRQSPNSKGSGQDAACLRKGVTRRTDETLANGTVKGANRGRKNIDNNALGFHHANQQVFALICSSTVGFTALDPSACGLNVFGSVTPASVGGVALPFSIGQIIGAATAGDATASLLLAGATLEGVPQLPVVALHKGRKDSGNGNTDCRASFFTYTGAEGARPKCGGPGDPTNFQNGATVGGSLGQVLSPQQEALLGCGPFWGTHCDDDGIDLLNMDASVATQSFIGFEGTGQIQKLSKKNGIERWNTAMAFVPQPGTVGFRRHGGPVCTPGSLSANPDAKDRIPGCYGKKANGKGGLNNYAGKTRGERLQENGNVNRVQTVISAAQVPNFVANLPNFQPAGTEGVHPFTGQQWQSEMAAWSWNFQMFLVSSSAQLAERLVQIRKRGVKKGQNAAQIAQRQLRSAYSTKAGECSFLQPQFCGSVESIFAVGLMNNRQVAAGGNEKFGRRTFQWHSGSQVLLQYRKRNVLGFSMDFAEDVTKSNFSLEFTWIESQLFSDSNKIDGQSESDTYNFTISGDRPTFINFLNQNRTFFINSQWFFQYTPGWDKGFAAGSAYNILGTLAVSTGFYQDRLLPGVVAVYDIMSGSGALIPQITYRYNEVFSVTLGAASFFGREQLRDQAVYPLGGAGNSQGPNQYRVAVENGLAVVRDRDEVFMRLRYTF